MAGAIGYTANRSISEFLDMSIDMVGHILYNLQQNGEDIGKVIGIVIVIMLILAVLGKVFDLPGIVMAFSKKFGG